MKILLYLKYLPISLLISLSFCIDGDIHDFFLPNGLRVIIMERHGAPQIGVNVAYNVGRHDEPKENQGINIIVKNVLANSETKKYPEGEVTKIRDEYDANYGDGSDADITWLNTEIHKNALDFVLDFESDRMKNTIFNNETIKIAKENYISIYEGKDNNIIQVSAAVNELWEGHPYESPSYPSPSQINKLENNSIESWYKAYYSPNNAVLTLVGDVKPEEVTKLIYQYFADIKPQSNIPADPNLSLNLINLNSDIIKKEVMFEGVPIYISGSVAVMPFPSSRDEDVLILQHLISILDFSFQQNNYLFEMFTKKGCLSLYSKIWLEQNLGFSYMVMNSNLIGKKIEIKKINNQAFKSFTYISENGIKKDLLESYKKNKLIKEYKNHYSYRQIANKLAHAELVLGDYKYYNKNIKALERLSNDQIQKIIKKYIINSNFKTLQIDANKKAWNFPALTFIMRKLINASN